MASGTFYSAAGGDDGYTKQSTSYFSNSTNALYLGTYTDDYDCFLRFPNIVIPVGSTVTSAILTLYDYVTEPAQNPGGTIYMNDEDDAVAPTNFAETEALSETAASVVFTVGAQTANAAHLTPDISAAVQEVINRAGWVEGNALMVVIRSGGSWTGSFHSYEAFYQPHLDITWTAPSPAEDQAAWNPLDKGADISVPQATDFKVATKGIALGHAGVRSNYSKLEGSGKWYWEINIAAGSLEHYIGVATSDADLDAYAGSDEYGWAYCNSGQLYHGGTPQSYGNSYEVGDVIGVALDMDAGKVWFSKNGVWQNNGDPEAGTGAAYEGIIGEVYAIWSAYYWT